MTRRGWATTVAAVVGGLVFFAVAPPRVTAAVALAVLGVGLVAGWVGARIHAANQRAEAAAAAAAAAAEPVTSPRKRKSRA